MIEFSLILAFSGLTCIICSLLTFLTYWKNRCLDLEYRVMVHGRCTGDFIQLHPDAVLTLVKDNNDTTHFSRL